MNPLILLGIGIFSLVFVYVAWKRLVLAALMVIGALPLYLFRFSIGPIPTTTLEIMLLVVVIVWGIKKNFPVRLRVTRYALPVTIFLFLLAATISVFVSPNIRSALGIYRAYFVEPILFFLVISDLLRSKQLSRHQIIQALSISALILSAYAIFQRFTGYGIPPPWDLERRVTSLFPYPNALGLFLAPLIPLFLSQISKKNFLRSTYYALTIFLSLLVIIFAHSTGAIVGIGGGLVVMATLYCVKKRNWKLLAAACGLLIIGSAVILSQPNLRKELLLQDWSGKVHKIQWVEATQMLRDTSTPFGVGRPIFGAGLDGYQETLKPYHKATYIEIFQYPHNLLLTFWSETGLLGVLSFIGLIVYFFVQVSKRLSTSYYLLATVGAMTIILIHGLVDIPYFKNDLAILFWLVYATSLEIN